MQADLSERFEKHLAGSYRIERELGGGGMARVFLAREVALSRDVVLKVLPPESAESLSADRFRREILTAATLSHPAIVPVLAAGDVEGVPWYTMPYIAGDSLRARLGRGPMTTPEAVPVLRDVARALAAAHTAGFVHRDIKPENILLAGDGAVVADFGIAKAMTASRTRGDATLTATGVAIGTPAYMAPEQLAGEATADHRVDIYAWGVVAYEMLTGAHPFGERTASQYMAAHATTPVPPIAPRVANLAPTLAALITRCLAKDPNDRPAEARELVSVLESSGSNEFASTKRGARWPIAIASVAGVAAVVAGVIWSRTRAHASDPHVVAVAPFRVAGASADVHFLREGVPDLLAPQLATLPSVKVASNRLFFDRWRRAAGDLQVDLPEVQASKVAREIGAAQVIFGQIVGNAQHVTISAVLMSSDGDTKPLASATVEGPADSASVLSGRLALRLVASGQKFDESRIRAVLSARPEAVRATLEGERLYRLGDFAAAAAAYAKAYQLDTTFKLAAARVMFSNSWLPGVGAAVSGEWNEIAWGGLSQLSGVDSALVVTLLGPAYPEPSLSSEWIAAFESATRRFPDSAEILERYGDWLFHSGSMFELPDDLRRSRELLRRAVAIDSSFLPATEHLAAIDLAVRDTAAARRDLQLLDRLMAVTGLPTLEIIADGTRDNRAMPPLPSVDSTAIPKVLVNWGSMFLDPGMLCCLRLTREAFDTFLDRIPESQRPRYAPYYRAWYNITGRPSLATRYRPPANVWSAIDAAVGEGDFEEGAAFIDSILAMGFEAWGVPSRPAYVLAVGQWARRFPNDSVNGRVRRAREAVQSARRGPKTPALSIVLSLLDAEDAAARKDPALPTVLASLADSGLVARIGGTTAEAVSTRIAQLALRVQRPALARRVVQRHFRYLFALHGSRGTRLRTYAEATEALGMRADAISAWQYYIELRETAEPALRQDLEDAKARLARLQSNASGN